MALRAIKKHKNGPPAQGLFPLAAQVYYSPP